MKLSVTLFKIVCLVISSVGSFGFALALVYFNGSVIGLSGAGITSGLASIGGNMINGLIVFSCVTSSGVLFGYRISVIYD